MQANLNWLTDPTIFRVNRLDAHSDHICYASAEELAQGESSLRQSLDGQWQFCWSKSPAQRPADFWQAEYDDSCFGTIQVPGHMELQGFGKIQYINTLYPWDGHAELLPPQIDWENTAVGSYVKMFDLGAGLLGKRVCISFQGVEQACYVWLNGQFVGYAEDSFTPSDFDLTPYIQEKNNRLCVEVYQRSSAAWLEDQDFFRFSGIFRSVYLYAKPAVHIEDLWLQAGLLEDNTTGTLNVRLQLSGETKGSCVHCHISGLFDSVLELKKDGQFLRSSEFTFKEIQPWCHETPKLYHVTLTLRNAIGEVVEVIPYEIGFRRFEVKEGIMLLNGKRLVIRGVNRHEWNPSTGRAIGTEDMEQAMATFRRNNINAVRTCHYPNQTPWYYMCDRDGIYMMDETNLESHGSWQKLGKVEPSWNVPGSLPEWKDCVLDRAKSMFERDKNHVSILFWSCGNESYVGADILAMAEFFRSVDTSRLVHYEGVVYNRDFDGASDVESRMYATPTEIRRYLMENPKKPFILCEYMHDMGNSLGGMESYIRLGEEFPMYQGGFIWDYMDQALWHFNFKGETVLGYGGDFDDRQSDYAFSGNGIVFADGTEKPAMQEVRYWYSEPENRAAQDASNKAGADAVKFAESTKITPLKIVHGDGALGISADGFEIIFSYPEGGPVSLISGGQEWLWRAPRPAYWRAPTENDLGNGFAAKSSIWSAVDSWQKCSDIHVTEESPDTVSICYTFTAPAMPGLKTDVTYIVKSDGYMDVKIHYYGADNRPQLPLLGLRFATPRPAATTEWIGLSGETYPDRKKGGIFGKYSEVPHIPDYLVPQECGCHMDTVQMVLHMNNSTLTMEKIDRLFAFSAIPYTPQQLSEACHAYELPEPCRTVVTVCGAMRGVGGIDSWKTDVEEAYHVPPDKDIVFSFRINLRGRQMGNRVSNTIS